MNLATIRCSQCGETATEVIHAEQRIRKGWYCPHCKHFEPAIRRERLTKEIGK